MRVLALFILLVLASAACAKPDDLDSQPSEIQRAYALLDAQQRPGMEEARAILEKAIAERPGDPFPLAEMARYEMKTGWRVPEHMARAQAWLEKARAADPKRADTYVLLGYVAFHKDGNYKQALAHFEEAERLGTGNPWLHANRGEVLLELGRLDAASASFVKVLDSPNAAANALDTAASRLLDIEGERGWPDVALGERLFLLKLESNPQYARHYLPSYIRFLAVNKGDVPKSLELGRKAVADYGGDLDSRCSLAVALLVAAANAKDRGRADAYAAEAKQASPDLTLPLVVIATYAPHQIEAMRVALANGASPDGVRGQLAPLNAATNRLDPILARMLLEAGADLNVPDFTGWPVLIQVLAREKFDPKASVIMVGTLLEFGADPLATHMGATVVDYVRKHRPEGDAIRTMIEDAAAKKSPGKTPAPG